MAAPHGDASEPIPDGPLAEELAAVQAIYGEDCEVDAAASCCAVYVPSRGAPRALELRLHLPADYPETCPAIELVAEHLEDELVAWATSEMEGQFMPGAQHGSDALDVKSKTRLAVAR